MYALNRVQLIGYVTETPSLRQTPAGQTVGDLNLLTRQTFINSAGAPQLSTAYHNIVLWRGLADIAGRFLKKGSQVFIAGRIQTDEWEDHASGQKRYKTRVIASDLILLDPKVENPLQADSAMLKGGLNQAEILGNVSRNPELRQTPNGDSVVNFGVATNFSWKDRAGLDQEKTEFHNVVAWGALAQEINVNIKKGRKIYVAGRLQTRSWETPEGQKRYTTEIIADRCQALGIHDEELGSSAGSSESQVTLSAPSPQAQKIIPENPTTVPAINYEPEIKPEDLPF